MSMSFSRSHKGSRTIFEVLDASSRDLPSRIRGVLETVSGGFASRLGSRRVRGLGPGRRHPMIWGHAATLLVTVVIALACLAAAVRRWFVVELGPLGDNGVFPEDWQDTKNAAGWS
jgi:hypothetical protein